MLLVFILCGLVMGYLGMQLLTEVHLQVTLNRWRKDVGLPTKPVMQEIKRNGLAVARGEQR